MARPPLLFLSLVVLFSFAGAPAATAEDSLLSAGLPQSEALSLDAKPLYWAEISGAQPVRDRSGAPRFVGAAFERSESMEAIILRIRIGGEGSAIRSALIRALAQTGGDFAPKALELFRSEADSVVRASICAVLRRGASASAREALLLGLADPEAQVREEAARALGWRDDGARLAGVGPALVNALGDPDDSVRATAARALGWLQVSGSAPNLRSLLKDPSGEVRLHALRSLGRLDEAGAGLSSLSLWASDLLADPDPRVSRVARRLSARR